MSARAAAAATAATAATAAAATASMVSVVVPVFNEADSVRPLVAEIEAALRPLGRPFEVVFVDDGSTDDTARALDRLPVRVIRHDRNRGQSAAVWSGIHAARGDVIVTLDGDGQNDPAGIPALLDALSASDAAVGVRVDRQDPLGRRWASRLARMVRGLLLQDGIADIGCALRAFPRRALDGMPAFDGLHRLLPALLVFRGLRVVEVPTRHRPRRAGASKYTNIRRGLRGLFDLLGLYWLKRRLLPVAHAAVGAAAGAPGSRPGGGAG